MLSIPPRLKVCRILVAAVAVLSLATVSANAAPREFTFEIDRRLLETELDFVDARDGQATAQDQVAQVIPAASRSTLESVYQQSSGSAAEAQPMTKGSGGFGKWLKKRWWVPTLVGLAVGVVLAEPFDGKDSPDDPN